VSKTKSDAAVDVPTKAINVAREKHARAYEPWTEKEDAKLQKSFEDGKSIGHIAQALRRQPSAIRSRLAKHGIDAQGIA
jgi:hypothetical protein